MSDIIERKECPYCSEMIVIKAKKCRFCGEILDQQMRDIEMLKSKASIPLVVNNNNNNNNNVDNKAHGRLRNFPNVFHFILTILTGGIWLFIWILHYLFRDKNYYY